MEIAYAKYLLIVNSCIRIDVATDKRIRQSGWANFWSTGFITPQVFIGLFRRL